MPFIRKPTVKAVVSGEVYLKDLPHEVEHRVKADLTLLNPIYSSTEKFGSEHALKNVPKHIGYYRQPAPNVLSVPRGYQVKGVALDETYNVSKPKASFPDPVISPRPNQETACKQWKTAIKKPYWDGTIVMPPAEGKTITCLFLAHLMSLKTLVLVHKDTIMTGWIKDIEFAFGGKLKYEVWKGKKSINEHTDAPLVIASTSTLKNADVSRWSDKFGLVLCDECHRSASHTICTLLENCQAAYRIGVTATPEREDGLDKVILFACGQVRLTIQKNLKQTVPLQVLRINTPFAVSKERENPDALRQHTIWKRQNGRKERVKAIGDLINFIKNHPKLSAPILVLANHTEACQMYADEFGGFHFKSGLSPQARLDYLESARAGNEFITVATPSMMGEGVNVPPWTHVIYTNSFTAKTLVRQTAGRVERSYPDKTKGYVWDLVDDCPRIRKQFGYRCDTYKANKFDMRFLKFVKVKGTWCIRERKKNAQKVPAG